jgi:hypothetical protein
MCDEVPESTYHSELGWGATAALFNAPMSACVSKVEDDPRLGEAYIACWGGIPGGVPSTLELGVQNGMGQAYTMPIQGL